MVREAEILALGIVRVTPVPREEGPPSIQLNVRIHFYTLANFL